MDLPVAASQSRAVLSSLPVRTALPSGLNATAATPPWWAMGGPMGSPVAASQSRAVSSSLPVRTALPSGLNATARTLPWWAMGGPMGLAVAGSQSRAVLSELPVRTALPSGLNATQLTARLVREHRLERDSWLCQAAMLARAACCQPGSPAATAERQLSTIQSRPGPVCPFSKAD